MLRRLPISGHFPFYWKHTGDKFQGCSLPICQPGSSLKRELGGQSQFQVVTVGNLLAHLGATFMYRRFHGPKLRWFHEAFPRIVDLLPFPNPLKCAIQGRVSRLFHHIACSRYSYYLQYLQGKCSLFKSVMLTDTRDVIFQADPFGSVGQSDLLLFLENADYRFGGINPDTIWMQMVYGAHAVKKYAGERISCCGTILGTPRLMVRYLRRMTHEIARKRLRSRDVMVLIKQSTIIFAFGRIPSCRVFENHRGPVLTMGQEPRLALRFDNNGSVCGEEGNPIPILHQFDRHLASMRPWRFPDGLRSGDASERSLWSYV